MSSPRYHVGDIVLYRKRNGRIKVARKNNQAHVQREQMNKYKKPGQYVSNLDTCAEDLYVLEETTEIEGRIIIPNRKC